MDKALRALVYVTSIDSRMPLAEKSRIAPLPGLTGLMVCRDGSIMCFLEGPSAEVRAALVRAELDPAIGLIIVVSDEPVAARELSTWSVAHTRPAQRLVIRPEVSTPEVLRWLDGCGRDSSAALHLIRQFLLQR